MTSPTDFPALEPALVELTARIQRVTRESLVEAVRTGRLAELRRHAAAGVGDVTFGLDVPAEQVLGRWLEERAAQGPLSLLSEETGWRHLGPRAGGGVRELAGPDHGGPRLVIDPIDGTRPLMHDLRSAWVALAYCPPGPDLATQRDVAGAVLAELATTRETSVRRLASDGVTTRLSLGSPGGAYGPWRSIRTDDDDRPDRGISSFFRYEPCHRPALARLEASFFERLVQQEGADPRTCYDDQYCSNAGQLVLLATGTYRFVVDARAWLARLRGVSTTTSKPYDVAAALLCARGAGAVVTAVDGSELDFPLDATTPVDFVGWANAGTHRRLAPHLAAALDALAAESDPPRP